ncbi:MAG TPA: FadR/GntR family transcriptional regulator [Jatrophihabitantaceae bacterium]|jgi:DNA-binding FadR family transcriptional regulator
MTGGTVAVTDEAIEKLKEMIVSGQLRPGDRLPREADLATDLGLSRSSLREAVRALSLVRILDVRQGDGTYVSSLAADTLLDALSFIVEFHHDASVLELLEVRRILEPAASAQAATRITDDALAELEEIQGRSNVDSSVEDLVKNDLEFHRAIAVASGNSVLASLIESLSGPTQRARVWRGITQEGALVRTLAEHRAIFDAIRSRDPELARTWATVHIAGVEDWIRTTLKD